MLNDYIGVLNLNEKEDNIRSLTLHRTVASIPVAGRYRIIDFALSNMVNAGIQNIGLFTKSKSRSLADHVGGGKPWDLDRKRGGMFLFNFGYTDLSTNDIEMFRNNIDFLKLSKENNIILSSSYMMANIDYMEAAKHHEKSKNDITIIYKKANNCKKDFIDCETLNLGPKGNVISVGKNTGVYDENNICMEMFLMSKETFIEIVNKCVTTGRFRRVEDAIYNSMDNYNVGTYEFKGYLQCINTIKSYYKFNMDCLNVEVNRELFFNNGLIFTKVKDEAPTKYAKNSNVSNSLIANGCVIEGNVENSIIFRRVHIKEGTTIKNSIVMQNCIIENNVSLENVIIDKNVEIGDGKTLKGDKEFPLIIEREPLV